ncbi:MAG TPA: DUF305 domain-containing protein [Micromonosporaceae bacterium]
MFRSIKRRLAVVALAVAGSLLLAGCGAGGDDSEDPATSGQATHNAADIAFATGMIPHHQQALEMAGLAADRAADPTVKDLAARIEKAQDPEIEQMSGWLRDWGQPVPTPGGGHAAHSGMPGMMSDAEMGSLTSASGTDFDRMFLEMMIRHHEGAIEMAKEEQDKGSNAEAKQLAESIATSQAAEVKEMRDLLDT